MQMEMENISEYGPEDFKIEMFWSQAGPSFK